MKINSKIFYKLLHKKNTVFKLHDDITYVTCDTKLSKIKNIECGGVIITPPHFLIMNAENISIIDHPKKNVFLIKNIKNNTFITKYGSQYTKISSISYCQSGTSISECINYIIKYYRDMPYSIKNLKIIEVDSISNEIVNEDDDICNNLSKILMSKLPTSKTYIREQYARNREDHLMVVLDKPMDKSTIKDIMSISEIDLTKAHSNRTNSFIRLPYTEDIDSVYESMMYIALKVNLLNKKIEIYECKDFAITLLKN